MRIWTKFFESRFAVTAVIFLLLIVVSVGLLFAANLLAFIAYRCEPKIEKIVPIVFLIVVAIQPLAIFRKSRATAGNLTWICSLVFGLWLATFAVAVIYGIWGTFGVIVGIWAWFASGRAISVLLDAQATRLARIGAGLESHFGGFVSIALLASAHKEAWNLVIILLFGIVLVFTTRFVSAMEVDLAKPKKPSLIPILPSAIGQ